MKILIVDDMEVNLELLQARLEGSGYEVTSAKNGVEALEKLKRDSIDMIISDILMPKMDGFQLCRECKKDDTLRKIPFIFYTATYTDKKDEEFALNLGAEKFIVKPAESKSFMEIIEGILKNYKKGLLAPSKISVKEEEIYLKEYNERLINKLEKKMLDLESEIIERERAEERVKHLNLVLVAIRKVNQLIIQEKDTNRLLQGVCDNLIENRGYYNAWIALLDDTGGLVATAEAGLGKDFLPIVERLKSGKMTDCVKKAQMQSGIVVTKDPPSTCTDCPLAKRYPGRAGFTARLEHDGKMYGLLTVSIPGDFAADEEEQSLLGEVAGDIGYALHNIELEKERKQMEEALKDSEERFRNLVETTSDWIWEVDENAVYTYVSPRIRDILGYEPEEILDKTPFDLMPPEESRRVADIFGPIVASRKPFECLENTNLHKDGQPVVLETSGVPIFDDEREFRGYRGIDRDITERKRAEEELEKHREHLEELVKERTAELTKTNEHLRQQIEERKRAEDALKKSTAELRTIVNAMAGREVRMAELKEAIQKLRTQVEEAGMTPVADDPLLEKRDL